MRAEIDILFFNRCAKVGSESLFQLLIALEKPNRLYVDRKGPQKQTRRELNERQQQEVVDYIQNLGPDSAYVEHVNWIDFHQFQLPRPIYINLVRDPVERMISWYYYVRNSYKNAIMFAKFPQKPVESPQWYKKDFNQCVRSGDPECQYVPYTVKDFTGNYKRQTLFFCGHTEDCLPFDSPVAAQIAKQRVEREYAVVGTWEETNITLAVLERYIPRFFKDATHYFNLNYQGITNQNKNHRKPHIDADVKELIRKNLTNEYDFYYFCKQRLYKQYLALRPQEIKSWT